MALNEALRARQQKPVATERAPRPPADMRPEEWQTRVDLTAAYRLAAIYGWTDLNNTHFSARIPGTEHFLLNPFGMPFWRHLLPARRPAAPAEFLVVNLIPEHDVEPHAQFPSHGDDGFWAAAAPKQGAVVTFEVDSRVGGDQASLAQDESEQGTALLGDLA